MRRYRVQIDTSLCCGTSNCAEEAPEAYEMDANAQPHVHADADDAAVLRGAQACPMSAIIVTELSTGRRIHP